MATWNRLRPGWSSVVALACALGLAVAALGFLPGGIATARAGAIITGDTGGCYTYIIAPGDTLLTIAATYSITVDDLLAVNMIDDPNLIFAGEQLCIPLDKATIPDDSTVTATATPPPDAGSAQGEAAFVAFVLPYAQRASADTGWPVSLILAQWGLEQGWSTPGFDGYNFGNCGAIPNEPTVPGTDAPGSPPAFSYAPTPEDGLRIYLWVAHLDFYTAVAPAAQTGGPDAAARALGQSPWDAGHYTVVDDPGSSLIAIMQDYNLYQYDQV